MGIPMGMGMGMGYGDRNSVPTAALDSAVGMGIPKKIPMGMGLRWVCGWKFRPHGSPDVQSSVIIIIIIIIDVFRVS